MGGQLGVLRGAVERSSEGAVVSLVVILAEGRTLTESLSAADILRAMRAAAPGSAQAFGWIGPAPRITRALEWGAVRGFITRVAWIGAWPPTTTNLALPNRASQQMLAENVHAQLSGLGGSWNVQALAYSPAVNGQLSWWRDGSATRTRTKDQFPVLGGRLDAVETPTGPTTPETRPSTLGEAASQVASGAAAGASGTALRVKEILTITAVIVVPIAIAIAVSSVSSTIREGRRMRAYR